MRAFRSGKRDFVKDEIVFVVDKLDNFMNILIGKINIYAGYRVFDRTWFFRAGWWET